MHFITPIYSYLQPIAMLAGKFIKLLVVATALSNADAGNGRKRNRRNRNANYAPVGTGGYGSISKNPTSAPIVAIVTPEPTLSPSLSPSMAKWNGDGHIPTTSPTETAAISENPTLSPVWNGDGHIPTTSPTETAAISENPTSSPVWKGDSWGSDGHATLSPSLSPTLPPTLSPSVSPTVVAPIETDKPVNSWNGDGFCGATKKKRCCSDWNSLNAEKQARCSRWGCKC
eukprot:g12808.t1.1.5e17418b g12808  g12808.t1 contig7:182075-183294(+)